LSVSGGLLAHLRISQGWLAPDDERDHGLVAGLGGRDFADELPLAQDHAAIGDGDDFFEVVADEDDRDAVAGKPEHVAALA